MRPVPDIDASMWVWRASAATVAGWPTVDWWLGPLDVLERVRWRAALAGGDEPPRPRPDGDQHAEADLGQHGALVGHAHGDPDRPPLGGAMKPMWDELARRATGLRGVHGLTVAAQLDTHMVLATVIDSPLRRLINSLEVR